MLDQIYVDDEDEEKVSPKVTILDLESDQDELHPIN